MLELLYGATAMGCVVAALFFWRFYRETSDRFFVGFAIAFVLLAVNRTALALSHPTAETTPYYYLLRLAAFLLIAWAIIDKNRRR